MSEIKFTVCGVELAASGGVTILDAMIKGGFNVVGHVGCKGGVCGACTCLIRYSDGRVQPSLACRTLVEEGMKVSFPEPKVFPVKYKLGEKRESNGIISELYPEIYNCVGCGKCTAYCTQNIDVRLMIENAKYGDLKKVSELSFHCIACGACSFSCPAKINHAEVGLIARRLSAKAGK